MGDPDGGRPAARGAMRSTIERLRNLDGAFRMSLVLGLIAPAPAAAGELVSGISSEGVRLDEPRGPPGELRVEASGDAAVAVRWDPSRDDEAMVAYEVIREGQLLVRTRALSFTDSGLAAASRYCYLVRTVDLSGRTSWSTGSACVTTPDLTPPETPAAPAIALDSPSSVSTTWPVVPDTTPPSAPTAMEASAPGETSVVLRWAPSTDDLGVVGYEVFRDGRLAARAPAAKGGDEGLRPSTAYCYTVRAYDAAGNRSDPSAPSCVTTPDLTPPSQPSMASATPLSDRSLRIVWLASTDNVGVTGYEVLRDGAVVSRSLELAAEVKGLAPGRDYCLEIQALDAAGNRSPRSTPACTRTPDLTPPSVPAGLLAAASSSSRISLAWRPSEDDVAVVGYEIWRGDVRVARSPATTWLENGLGPSTEHCFQVRAFDAAGNGSDRSLPVCARTAAAGTLAAPVELEVDPAGSRAVTLKWKPSPDPGVVYAVFWDGEKRIGSTRFSTYRVDGLSPGQRRCFQVAAVDQNGNSSPKTWPVCAATTETPSASAR